MEKDYFVTEFNERIPIRPGYSKYAPPPYDCRVYESTTPGETEPPFGIFSDLWEASIFYDWVMANPLCGGRKHEKLLDIGGNTGLIARFLKTFGFAKKAYCIDICNFSGSLHEETLNDVVKEVVQSIDYIYAENENMPPTILERALRKLLKFRTNRCIAKECKNMFSLLQTMYPYPFPNSIRKIAQQPIAKLDDYMHSNVFELEEKYDCITLFSSLDHFDPEQLFLKAKDLLEPGGRLYVWHMNWFYIIFGPCVFGEFPYMAQRLTKKDIARYFDEFAPGKKEQALKALSYWHNGALNNGQMAFTLGDYLETADRAGLKSIATHRLRTMEGKIPVEVANWRFIGDHSEKVLKEAVRDVKHFCKEVSVDDFLTQSFYMVFEKDR